MSEFDDTNPFDGKAEFTIRTDPTGVNNARDNVDTNTAMRYAANKVEENYGGRYAANLGINAGISLGMINNLRSTQELEPFAPVKLAISGLQPQNKSVPERK